MTFIDRRNFLTFSGAAVASLAMPRIARAATRQLRIGHNNAPTSVVHAGADAFAKAVASLSNGALSVDVYPSSQLGNEQQMMKAVADGSLDLSIVPSGVTSSVDKDVGLLELPYLFRDAGVARRALDGSLGQHCAERLKAKGLVVVGWGEVGLRHFTANKPIRTPADLKGLKLRVPLSEPILQTFKAMGAAAETLPFAQLVEALRTGRFEAQENPISNALASNFETVQSHLSLTGHVFTPAMITISGDVLDELSAADRETIAKAGLVGAQAMRDAADRTDRDGLVRLKSLGMTVVDDVDRAAFKRSAGDAIETLASVFGVDSLRRVQGLVS